MSQAATLHDSGHDGWEVTLNRLQRLALLVGAVGVALLLIFGIFAERGTFIRSYLFAFVFWAGIPLGSLSLLMLQHMTGGTWGLTLRRFLEAASWLVLLLAVLVIPILLAVVMHREDLYPWLAHNASANGQLGHSVNPAHLWFKELWLEPTFFIARTVIYFVLWGGMALYLYGFSGREDRNGYTPVASWRARRVSAPGLLIYGLSLSFAAVDWVMSLDPSWYSTIWGILFIVGNALSTMSFMIAIIALIADRRPIRDLLSPGLLNDLGNLLMAFLMLWAYINFSQFLIMWSGNVAEEVPYYYFRTRGGWAWIALFLVVFHFFAPFMLLLWRRVKRDIRTLAMVAIAVFCVRTVDLFWVVKPMFLQREITLPQVHAAATHSPAHDAAPGATQPAGTQPAEMAADSHAGEVHVPGPHKAFMLTDLPALAGIGGIFVAAFIWKLKQRPLLAPNDPRVAELAAAHH